MRKNGGVLERFLKSLLVAIFVTVAVFTDPARADDACKNLFDYNIGVNSVIPRYNGVDFQVNNQGLFTLTGTSTGGGGRNSIKTQTFTLPAGTYTVSFSGTKQCPLYLVNETTNNNLIESNTGGKFTLATETPLHFGINIPRSGITYDDSYYIQLERGDTATAYQPYNPLCATCDGTVVNYTTVTENEVPAGVQNGTPSPTNPIEPVFYTQGDMVLRRIGDYADSYDATTGKITRRVGVKVLKGTENWGRGSYTGGNRFWLALCDAPLSQYIYSMMPQYKGVLYQTPEANVNYSVFIAGVTGSCYGIFVRNDDYSTASAFKSYLAEQYANGTPVTVYYPLANEVEEDWPATRCAPAIKIATTKYSNTQFTPVVNALNTAVSTIKDVVENTINQTAAIAQIASDKQTRPDSACPAGKTCLLVEDADGTPHWYEIIEEYIPPE